MRQARVVYEGRTLMATPCATGVRLSDGTELREEQVTWLPPAEFGTVFALGLNYADHAKELKFQGAGGTAGVPERTECADRTPPSHASARRTCTFMHYECELAVVIGKTCKKVPARRAYDFRGYTVANDYAIRDYLENWYRPNLRVKNRDACTPLGPWLVDGRCARSDGAAPADLGQRQGHAGRQHPRHDLRRRLPDRVLLRLHDAESRRPDPHRHARRRRRLQAGRRVVTEIEGIGALINTIE
jgi:5-oxopent-3-ene-1,2,5-tricarboxylate decarboxylase/2-hydroxyhepta-2,4-diene-1,7-dioate isomerase